MLFYLFNYYYLIYFNDIKNFYIEYCFEIIKNLNKVNLFVGNDHQKLFQNNYPDFYGVFLKINLKFMKMRNKKNFSLIQSAYYDHNEKNNNNN